jgi:hypothetical protein
MLLNTKSSVIVDDQTPDGNFNLNESTPETAKIIMFFDKLFDSLNGGTLRPHIGKPLTGGVTQSSPHLNFWKESIGNLKAMSFEGSKPPSLKNFIVTLEGFISIHEKLQGNGFKFFYHVRLIRIHLKITLEKLGNNEDEM